MEKMPYQPDLDSAVASSSVPATTAATTPANCRDGLSLLTGTLVTLRELRIDDAPSLIVMLATEEVSRFISPPPSTVDGFERFITWTHRQRAAGQYACFAVVPHGSD